MALLKKVTKEVYGEFLTFPNSYHQVLAVTGGKGVDNTLNARIAIYKDDTKQVLIDEKLVSFMLDSDENAPRWDKQAYNYLKTLDEYIDSIDC